MGVMIAKVEDKKVQPGMPGRNEVAESMGTLVTVVAPVRYQIRIAAAQKNNIIVVLECIHETQNRQKQDIRQDVASIGYWRIHEYCQQQPRPDRD